MLAENHPGIFVKINKLSLNKQNQLILDQVGVSFADKSITVLLGANGAGKSTLLRVLSGLYTGDSGEIDWLKAPQSPDPKRVAYVSEPAVFYPHLTVEEQLLFHAGSHKLLPMNAEQALAQWQLIQVAKKKTSHLSLGYRQRLAMAQAFMQRPRLLLLDEPMNGMDPELMSLFKSELLKIKQHGCVVMASHLLHMMDDLIDEVVVMAQGRVVSQEPKNPDKNLYQMYQESMESPENMKKSAVTGGKV